MRTPVALATLIALGLLASPAGAATLAVEDTAGTEGTPVKFRVFLDAPTDKVVTVDYTTVSGTAKSKDDFKAASGRLTFEPGGFQGQLVAVSTASDTKIDRDETFIFRISNAVGADIADSDGVATLENVPLKGACKNTLTGTKIDDLLEGTDKGDLINGLAGADTINGLRGDDCLDGRGGKDTLNGGKGDDELSGGGDKDTLDGGDGDDKINAGSGKNNVVLGGPGNDNIATQNDRKDTVDCGPGKADKIRGDPEDSIKNCERKLGRH